eukprot:GHVU01050232.1.p1 GENE.GHVU01050232.1~~GHVU01050232.1.p1  ORF type:complete len:130 (-),score=8.34 GHVU01050232.1:603-992(-)
MATEAAGIHAQRSVSAAALPSPARPTLQMRLIGKGCGGVRGLLDLRRVKRHGLRGSRCVFGYDDRTLNPRVVERTLSSPDLETTMSCSQFVREQIHTERDRDTERERRTEREGERERDTYTYIERQTHR